MTILNKDSIIQLLPDLTTPAPTPDTEDPLKASSVLLILHQIENCWHLLLTTRAAHLKHHAGQISFPGGRFENEDIHLLNTALRETEEEIGVKKHFPKIICQLNNHPTLTGYRIFPFVAIVEQLPELSIDSGEVENVFSVPLNFLMDENNHQSESVFYDNKPYNLYTIIWQEKIIWGATAGMIVNLSEYINKSSS